MVAIVKIIPKTIEPAIVKVIAAVGPAGPAGPKGDTGLTGPAGPQGIQGEPGQILSPVEMAYSVQGGTTSGIQPTFNGSPLFSASYVKVGKFVHFRINVLMTNITDFGSGQYYMTLPFNAKYDYYFRDGQIHDASQNKSYSISGHVSANSNVMTLYSTASNGTEVSFTSSVPFSIATDDDFHISGNFITAS